MRTVFALLIVLFLVSTLNITTSDAQDSPQWHLPEGAIARLGKGPVHAVAYSPDGRYLAVGGGLGIWIYDVPTGAEVALLREPRGSEHRSNVNSIAFSPDETMIVGGGDITRVWDIATGTITSTIPGDDISSVAYSPDGNTIATVGFSSAIFLSDAATGILKDRLSGHSSTVTDIVFSPDGRTIASAAGKGLDRTMRLWDAATGTQLHKFEHENSVNSIAYSPDSSVIASGVSDRGVHLWNVATGTLIRKFGGIHHSIVDKVAYSPDGRTIATVFARYGQVHLWDAATGTPKNTLEHKHKTWRYRVNSVAFSPDGNTIASGSLDGTVRLWNVSTGALKNTITGHIHQVHSVAYNPDGSTIAGGGGARDQAVRLWDTATGTLRRTLIGHTSWGGSVAFSPDGNTVASGSGDHAIRLWDAATGTLKNTLKGIKTISAPSIAYSPDGHTIAAAGKDLMYLWDAATGTVKNTLIGPTANSVVYSPDGNTIAAGSQDGTVRLWSAATGILTNTFKYTHPGSVFSIAYSPDGTTLASSFPPAARTPLVHLWNVATGTLRYTFEHGSIATVVAYSPDGRTIATGNYEGIIHLWNAANGDFIKRFTGHIDRVESIAFSPDGRILASGSYDGTVLLWGLTPSVPIPAMAPEFTEGSRATRAIAENTQLGVNIGTPVAATDADNDTLTYTLSGTDANAFSLDTTTGQLRTRAALDHETKSVYTVIITASDGKLTDSITVTINITDINETISNTAPPTDETDETGGESTDDPPSDLTSGQTLLSSDEFNGIGQNLDTSWQVKNGDRSPWTLKDGQLVVDAGFNQNLWRDDTSTRFYQVMDQDQFTLETSMVVDYADVCAVAGLVVYSPTTKDPWGRNGNWVTLKFWGQGNGAILQYQHREREIVARQPGYSRPQGSIPIAMRLERDGDDYEAWFKPDAQGEWVSVGKTTLALQDPLQVGVYAGICQGQAPGKLNVKFDYFRVTTPELVTTPSTPEPVTTPSTLVNTYNAQDKLTGPWLWMIAPTAAGQGGALATDVDSLAAASGGTVTEADVAANGANEGDKVGALEWTLGEISATGGNNINDVINETGLGGGDINDHSSYALITLVSDTDQSNVTMRVGSDDSIKVWLNGEVVHIFPFNRGAGDFQETFKVNLKRGDNLLLVKVSERRGGWSMFVGFDVNVTYKVPTRDAIPVPAADAYPAWDVNEDGQTNIIDLILVLTAFGKTPIVNPRTDVNGNGTVDKQDIIIVATHLGESTTLAAPISVALPERLTPETLRQTLDLLRAYNDGSLAFQRGIAHLEQLLALLIPKETTLLANYPNPFNPETWIPYQLANPTDVSVRIYSVNGSLVRHLSLGHQAAGMYRSRSRAAYWDGRNEFGESVASGVYFYTLTAGDFTATRKMLIRK